MLTLTSAPQADGADAMNRALLPRALPVTVRDDRAEPFVDIRRGNE